MIRKAPIAIFLVFALILPGSTIAIPVSVITKIDDLLRITRTSRSIKTLYKIQNALPESEIKELSGLLKSTEGLKKVGQILGKGNYTDDVLENAYIRIAIDNNVISKEYGEQIFRKFSGKDGFRTLVRKINTANSSVVKGHLAELQIANEASEKGFKLVSFGMKYSDDLKKADTDMDILLEKGGKLFAVESKAYSRDVPMDIVRADAESLLNFSSSVKDCNPIFAFSKIPAKTAQKYLKSRKINVASGTPEEIVLKLDHIAQCLGN